MNNIDISVIVPVYNVEKYIERCLRSLFTQTKTEGVEFIIVNDATPDNSVKIAEDIIKEYPTINVSIIHHATNKKLASARKSGFIKATGDYIIHIDSDDWCEPTMLEKLYDRIKQTNSDIIGCGFYRENTDRSDYIDLPLPSGKQEFYLKLFENICYCSLWNKMISRRLYAYNVPEFYFIDGINQNEDFYTICKLLYYANRIEYISEGLYHYDVSNPFTLSNCPAKHTAEERFIVVDGVDKFIKEKYCSEEVINALLKYKLSIKLQLVSQATRKKYKEYVKVWPEIDEYLYMSKTLSKRLIYNIVFMGCFPISKLMFCFLDVIQRFKFWKHR